MRSGPPCENLDRSWRLEGTSWDEGVARALMDLCDDMEPFGDEAAVRVVEEGSGWRVDGGGGATARPA